MRRGRQESPFSSPTRKKSRPSLESSPFSESNFPVMSQDDLSKIDEIEARFLESKTSALDPPSFSSFTHRASDDSALSDDADNPFFTKPEFPVASTSSDHSDSMTLSQEQSENHLSDWFTSSSTSHLVGFQTPSFASVSSLETNRLAQPGQESGFQLASGFQTASKRELVPSKAALAMAQAKIKAIWDEGDENEVPILDDEILEELSQRPALAPVNHNALSSTLKPISGFTRANANTSQDPIKPRHGLKAFKSPFIQTDPTKTFSTPFDVSSPLNIPATIVRPSLASALSQQLQSSTPIKPKPFQIPSFLTKITHAPSQSLTDTPSRFTPLQAPSALKGMSIHSTKKTPARFVTPFKPGMKPGEPGRLKLPDSTPSKALVKPLIQPAPKSITTSSSKRSFAGPSKTSLLKSGLLPQQYTKEELIEKGIAFEELSCITPSLALYYSFYNTVSESSPSVYSFPSGSMLGVAQAYSFLKKRNFPLATEEWVNNHWSLILWKQAGMAALDPDSEAIECTRRWSWHAVIEQLKYRYERELNKGTRPPLRLITARDVPPTSPMILCISNIIWPNDETLAPELEVTDGWYRLRATVDKPLERAVRKGVLRIGRKISIAGIDLSSKEPAEILEAYNSLKLVLIGNSSHLAPWHAKLGFQRKCPISTMHSLTADGGVVPCMDVVVLRVFPIEYYEFYDDNGQRRSICRSSKEEQVEVNKWRKCRENEESKIRREYEQKHSLYESYVGRLERKAGASFKPGASGPPDCVYSMYDELEEPDDAAEVLAHVSSFEAGWLAKYIRERAEKDQDKIRDQIERDLESAFPPRKVHSIRLIVAQDSQIEKHQANRMAHIVIWDILNFNFAEERPMGDVRKDDRLLMTRLHPTHFTSWMGHEPDDQIFLCSRGPSTIQRLR